MKKNLQYFMHSKYQIEVLPITEEDGGGYEARIPQLGKYLFVGWGETIVRAIESLEKVKRHLFANYIRKGMKIPEPKIENEDYSGKFVVRLPVSLHKQLAEKAKLESVSLNQFVLHLLSSNYEKMELREEFRKIVKDISMSKRTELQKLLDKYKHEIPEYGKFVKTNITAPANC